MDDGKAAGDIDGTEACRDHVGEQGGIAGGRHKGCVQKWQRQQIGNTHYPGWPVRSKAGAQSIGNTASQIDSQCAADTDDERQVRAGDTNPHAVYPLQVGGHPDDRCVSGKRHERSGEHNVSENRIAHHKAGDGHKRRGLGCLFGNPWLCFGVSAWGFFDGELDNGRQDQAGNAHHKKHCPPAIPFGDPAANQKPKQNAPVDTGAKNCHGGGALFRWVQVGDDGV